MFGLAVDLWLAWFWVWVGSCGCLLLGFGFGCVFWGCLFLVLGGFGVLSLVRLFVVVFDLLFCGFALMGKCRLDANCGFSLLLFLGYLIVLLFYV